MRPKRAQRPVGLLDGPPQLPPESDKKIDADPIGNGGRKIPARLRRGVFQESPFEIAPDHARGSARRRVPEHKHLPEAIRPQRFQFSEEGGPFLVEVIRIASLRFIQSDFESRLFHSVSGSRPELEVLHGIGDFYPQLPHEFQFPQSGVDEARLNNFDELLVGHPEPPGQSPRGLQLAHGIGRERVAEQLEPLARGRIGEQLVFLGRDSQVLGENLRLIIGRRNRGKRGGRKQGQAFQRTERLQSLPQGRFEMAEEQAHGGEPQVERERERIAGILFQDLIGFGQDVLRLGDQVLGSELARVVPHELLQQILLVLPGCVGIQDVVLQDFVDQIDVGQDRIGILASQRQMRQVGPVLQEYLVRGQFLEWLLARVVVYPAGQLFGALERIRSAAVPGFPTALEFPPGSVDAVIGIGIGMLEKPEQIHQVSRRAQHGLAFLAFAEVLRAQQLFHGRVLTDERAHGDKVRRGGRNGNAASPSSRRRQRETPLRLPAGNLLQGRTGGLSRRDRDIERGRVNQPRLAVHVVRGLSQLLIGFVAHAGNRRLARLAHISLGEF